jgi:hypothetical protein
MEKRVFLWLKLCVPLSLAIVMCVYVRRSVRVSGTISRRVLKGSLIGAMASAVGMACMVRFPYSCQFPHSVLCL